MDEETGLLRSKWHIQDSNPGPSTPKPTLCPLIDSLSPQVYKRLGRQETDINVYAKDWQTVASRPNQPITSF